MRGNAPRWKRSRLVGSHTPQNVFSQRTGWPEGSDHVKSEAALAFLATPLAEPTLVLGRLLMRPRAPCCSTLYGAASIKLAATKKSLAFRMRILPIGQTARFRVRSGVCDSVGLRKCVASHSIAGQSGHKSSASSSLCRKQQNLHCRRKEHRDSVGLRKCFAPHSVAGQSGRRKTFARTSRTRCRSIFAQKFQLVR